MRFLAIIILTIFLAGCEAAENIAMQIENPNGSSVTLVGIIEKAEQAPDVRVTIIDEIKFIATDGELSCYGESFKYYRTGDIIKHNFPIECSDGRDGNLSLTLSQKGIGVNITGVGVGKLSDGSKVKAIVGASTATMNW